MKLDAAGDLADRQELAPASLSILPLGSLDLGNNELIAPATLSTVRSHLFNGRLSTSIAGGAIGYLDHGEGTTLVRYTLAGDANLDGKVNALDFDALASNFGGAGSFWTQGDFNYDGAVTSMDFVALAMNFNSTLPAVFNSSQPVSDNAASAPTTISAAADKAQSLFSDSRLTMDSIDSDKDRRLINSLD